MYQVFHTGIEAKIGIEVMMIITKFTAKISVEIDMTEKGLKATIITTIITEMIKILESNHLF